MAFRYERLVGWCYNCGNVGHDQKECTLLVDIVNGEKLYGEWLKVGPRGQMMEASEGQNHAHRNRTFPHAQPQTTAMPSPHETAKPKLKKSMGQIEFNASPIFAEQQSRSLHSHNVLVMSS